MPLNRLDAFFPSQLETNVLSLQIWWHQDNNSDKVIFESIYFVLTGGFNRCLLLPLTGETFFSVVGRAYRVVIKFIPCTSFWHISAYWADIYIDVLTWAPSPYLKLQLGRLTHWEEPNGASQPVELRSKLLEPCWKMLPLPTPSGELKILWRASLFPVQILRAYNIRMKK